MIKPTFNRLIMTIIPNFCFALKDELQSHCDKVNKIDASNVLNAEMFLPTQADPESTGYDVRCATPEGIVLVSGCYIKIPLGFRMFAPKGWWLQLAPRSSTFLKLHVHALYGIIDETFENEMMFVGQYIPDACQLVSASSKKMIKFGERIAQVIPVERKTMTVMSVSNTTYDSMVLGRKGARGRGGFGASGKI